MRGGEYRGGVVGEPMVNVKCTPEDMSKVSYMAQS